jgi:hypothetical protein
MIRVVLQNIILFLLPTVLYVAYAVVRQKQTAGGSISRALEGAPFGWLMAAGAALMIGGLAYFGSETGGRPGDTYQPPVYRDGKIIPGQRK